MDLRLFLNVLWRFRAVVAIGAALTLALALLSYVRLELDDGRPTLSYRAGETWSSTSTILVTERGFPWGRSLLENPARPDVPVVPQHSDPARFTGLAVLYATLATSDEVRAIVRKGGPIKGTYTAETVRSPDGATFLPFVRITALSDSAVGATKLAKRVTAAFQTYLAKEQRANKIPPARRVQVPVVNQPRSAEMYAGRSRTKPILIAFLGLTLTVVLAFVLENVRPRIPMAMPAREHVLKPETRRAARTG